VEETFMYIICHTIIGIKVGYPLIVVFLHVGAAAKAARHQKYNKTHGSSAAIWQKNVLTISFIFNM
jgi:hypothetical protein